MWASSLFRRIAPVGHGPQPPAERAARWLRDRLEAETRARFGWLDAGVWADASHSASGAPGGTQQAAKRLTNASLIGDEVA